MKRISLLFLCLILSLTFTGCGKTEPPANSAAIANPWQSFATLSDAEAAAGFPLGMPETIAESYKVSSFRVMHDPQPLLEVVYHDESYEVAVRKAPGEGQDISGVYGFAPADTGSRNGITIEFYRPAGQSETQDAVITKFDFDGYSWSLYAPNGYWGDSCEDFLNAVLPISLDISDDSEAAVTEYPALVMAFGTLYYDSAELSTVKARCGMLDGIIDSVCEGNIPEKDNQSNFGTGYGYQIGANRIEVLIGNQWHVFLPFVETDEQWKSFSFTKPADIHTANDFRDSPEYQSFLGLHTSGYDGSTILIEEAPTGKLQIEICLFRLCDLENLSGSFEFDMIHFCGIDPSGDEIKGALYYNEQNSLCLEIQESTWDYLPEGSIITGFDD